MPNTDAHGHTCNDKPSNRHHTDQTSPVSPGFKISTGWYETAVIAHCPGPQRIFAAKWPFELVTQGASDRLGVLDLLWPAAPATYGQHHMA